MCDISILVPLQVTTNIYETYTFGDMELDEQMNDGTSSQRVALEKGLRSRQRQCCPSVLRWGSLLASIVIVWLFKMGVIFFLTGVI